MFSPNSHVGMDEFLCGIMDLSVVALHTRVENNNLGYRENVVGGGGYESTSKTIKEAIAGTKLCLTYRNELGGCSHLMFIKVDDIGVFFIDEIPGYSFADEDMVAKVVSEAAEFN